METKNLKNENNHDLTSSYFQYTGITKKITELFNVQILNHGTDSVEIHYPYLNGSINVYKPFNQNKWVFINPKKTSEKAVVFGAHLLPEKGEYVVVTDNEEDTMALFSLNIPSICIHFQTSYRIEDIIKHLKSKFDEVILLLCNETQNNLEGSILQIPYLDIPKASFPKNKVWKKVTDYLIDGKSKADMEKILKIGIAKFYRKSTYYSAELFKKMDYWNEDYIIPGIIFTNSLFALVGGSDSGKSLLSLQFAISHVLGKDFLGQKISQGKNVLFISLEDSQGSMKERFKKLSKDLTPEEFTLVEKNLHFCHESESFHETIGYHLQCYPETALIIIDNFSEMAAGKDMNSAGEVRSLLKPYHDLCIQNDLSILIIHHIGKSAEREGNQSKLAIVGSQSFESTMRLVFHLKKTKSNGFELAIVKGNDIDESLKNGKGRLVLKQSKETLWFSTNLDSIQYKEDDNAKEVDWNRVFKDKPALKTSEIKSILLKLYYIKDKQAEKLLSQELGNYRIKIGYYSNPTLNQGKLEDEDFNF